MDVKTFKKSELISASMFKAIRLSTKLLGYTATQYWVNKLLLKVIKTHPAAAQASMEFLLHIASLQQTAPLASQQHIQQYYQSVITGFKALDHQIAFENIEFPNYGILQQLINQQQGAILLTGELGNITIANELCRFQKTLKLNYVNVNYQPDNNLLDTDINIINAHEIRENLLEYLSDKLQQGEFIILQPDRFNHNKVPEYLTADWLTHPTAFSALPFQLVQQLKAPNYFMLCLASPTPEHYRIVFEAFTEEQLTAELACQRYADLLGYYCQQYPLQWFNCFTGPTALE